MTREDWVEIELKEIFEIVTGNTPPKKDPSNYNGNIPFIKPPNICNKLVTNAEEFLSKKGAGKSRILPPNSILVTCIGNLGRVGFNKQEIAFNQQINAIKPINRIHPLFTFYQAQSPRFRKELHANSSATTVSIINKGSFEKITYFLGPLPEQRAIVAKIEQLFSDLDNGIADLKKAQEQLKIYRQAVLKKAFEGELTKEWREKQTDLPSAEELMNQISEERQKYYDKQLEEWKIAAKDWANNGKIGKRPIKPTKRKDLKALTEKELADFPKLPNLWQYIYLAYAGDLGRGKSKHRPRNDKRLFGGIFPFFQTGDVKAQKLMLNYKQSYSRFGLEQSKLWPKGTLCITIAANIAETGFLGIDACFPDSIVGFTPFPKIANPKFIDYFFHSAKAKISSWAPATAQKNINLTILENLVIPFTSIKEQSQIVQEIESRLSVCDKVEQTIIESLQKAEALRQSILKKAFEGRLLSNEELDACRKEKDYEPASELLKKIKAEKLRNEEKK